MSERTEIVRECFRAYETGERDLVERHLSADFTFYSPPDPGIDLAAYWERCWPNAEAIASFRFARVIENGDEVAVTYEATRANGTRFRNTEVFAFRGDQVLRVEVYFGWDLPAS